MTVWSPCRVTRPRKQPRLGPFTNGLREWPDRSNASLRAGAVSPVRPESVLSLDVRWSVTESDDRIDAGLVERVLGEYREMPGLALTLEQARRLWGCDAVTCQCIADVLVARHVLRWSRDRRLVRAE